MGNSKLYRVMFLMNPNLKETMEATNIVGSQADRYCDQNPVRTMQVYMVRPMLRGMIAT